MQILNAYSIYDRKALVYHPPFYLPTDGSATRAFADTVNDATTSISRHPEDYVLYCVGTFLDTNGRLEALTPIRHVADATQVASPTMPLFANQTDLQEAK